MSEMILSIKEKAGTASWLKKLSEVRVMGMSLPVFGIVAALTLYCTYTGIMPANMVGALTIMIVLGSLFNLIGNKLPIVRSYLAAARCSVFSHHLRWLPSVCCRSKSSTTARVS